MRNSLLFFVTLLSFSSMALAGHIVNNKDSKYIRFVESDENTYAFKICRLDKSGGNPILTENCEAKPIGGEFLTTADVIKLYKSLNNSDMLSENEAIDGPITSATYKIFGIGCGAYTAIGLGIVAFSALTLTEVVVPIVVTGCLQNSGIATAVYAISRKIFDTMATQDAIRKGSNSKVEATQERIDSIARYLDDRIRLLRFSPN